MKKSIHKILLVLLMTTFLLSVVMVSFAADDSNLPPDTDAVYILSKDCPEEYIQYAENNVARFILGSDEYDVTDFASISIGTPFSFSENTANIFYFPVYGDQELIYLFRVFPDGQGGFSGVLSSGLVDQIKTLSPTTSESTPISLIMEDHSIIAVVGGESHTLLTYPSDSPISDTIGVCRGASQFSVLCIEPETEIDFSSIPAPATDYTQKYLELHGYTPSSSWPLQGNNNWCAAYAFCAIMKYIGIADMTAEELIIACYGPGNYTTETTFAEMMGIAFAQTRGSNPILVYTAADFGVMSSEIWGNRPVEMGMGHYVGSRRESGHAIVLRGFNSTTQTYSIWNPWYSFYETYGVGGAYAPISQQNYILYHDMTTYNWTSSVIVS